MLQSSGCRTAVSSRSKGHELSEVSIGEFPKKSGALV